MNRALLGSFAALGIVASPVSAQSPTCSDLRVQRASNNLAMLGVATDYPRTHVSIVACLAQDDAPENERYACAALVVVGACLGMGSAACSDLTSRWERISRTNRYVTREMRALGCRP